MQISEINYADNVGAVKSLWEDAFGRSLSEAQAEWFFCGPRKNLLYVAIADNGDFAGMYCMLKHAMSTPFGQTICYLCNNVCSHPKYRDQNIFVKLGRYVNSGNMELTAVSIGFPNDKACPGHKRVGWSFHSPLAIYESPTYSEINYSEDYSFDLIADPVATDLRNDKFLNCAESYYILKDADYIRWRYVDRPVGDRAYYVFGVKFKMDNVGYVVISARGHTGYAHIVDLACRDLGATGAALNYAKFFAYKLGLKMINVLGSPHLAAPAELSGFYPSESFNHLISQKYASGPGFDLLRHHQKLNFVFGDNDVY
jgi:hypothetical protein